LGLNLSNHRNIFLVATIIAPRIMAQVLARRYLTSTANLVDSLGKIKQEFSVIELDDDSSVVRFKNLRRDAAVSRVLFVPGHDGHFRQFARLVKQLTTNDVDVDVLVLPGHVHPERTVCSVKSIVISIRTAFESLGGYDCVVAHCVSSNSVILP